MLFGQKYMDIEISCLYVDFAQNVATVGYEHTVIHNIFVVFF